MSRFEKQENDWGAKGRSGGGQTGINKCKRKGVNCHFLSMIKFRKLLLAVNHGSDL